MVRNFTSELLLRDSALEMQVQQFKDKNQIVCHFHKNQAHSKQKQKQIVELKCSEWNGNYCEKYTNDDELPLNENI